ncbi:enolase C-terminal domain-like protein [Paraburkholderia oxyphila]|uniref:enolase C-terminal domain-like protein n=1 Tax=Paraburkholderia oxyphila TaxID=614212 RepID=UPI0004829E50|nr:enolase C-terminal domain-like protein [Paraburkholderia oxyphila]
MTAHPLKLRSLTAVPVSIPLKRPVGTKAHSFRTAAFLLLTLDTEEGVSGRSYAFCYLESIARSLLPIVADLSQVLAGHAVSPVELSNAVARYFKLPGLYGPLCMVASSIDAAAWDALAVSANMPLATLLGATVTGVRAYNSNGLGLMEPSAAADEAEELVAGGFRAVKMRVGRPTFAEDLAAIRAVRNRLADDVNLMVDFNQALSFSAAMEYCPLLDEEGVYWIEEPIRHDDFTHASMIAAATRTPIQLGENLVSVPPLLNALKADATDYLMFDLDRIGGVSGWRLASGLALAAGREVSSHLFPEISAHLLAATPTMHWLEYLDWADPILEEPLRIENGMAMLTSKPGNGITWNADGIEKYRLD